MTEWHTVECFALPIAWMLNCQRSQKTAYRNFEAQDRQLRRASCCVGTLSEQGLQRFWQHCGAIVDTFTV
jgi:hypothetical protein